LINGYLEGDDERVLAGEEDVHVGDQVVVGDQKKAENKEWGVLQKRGHVILIS
jgi:hypothetical protein